MTSGESVTPPSSVNFMPPYARWPTNLMMCTTRWKIFTQSCSSSRDRECGLLDTLTRQEMPLKPKVFHGRDNFVEHIARLLLLEETSHVCILGPGGMGKTSVSLAVVELFIIKERFPSGNIVWVPCIEATSATLLLEILYTQLEIPGDKQVTLEKIISELDTMKQPGLIVVDNFETPWNGNKKQVGDILRRLAILSHIATSSRCVADALHATRLSYGNLWI